MKILAQRSHFFITFLAVTAILAGARAEDPSPEELAGKRALEDAGIQIPETEKSEAAEHLTPNKEATEGLYTETTDAGSAPGAEPSVAPSPSPSPVPSPVAESTKNDPTITSLPFPKQKPNPFSKEVKPAEIRRENTDETGMSCPAPDSEPTCSNTAVSVAKVRLGGLQEELIRALRESNGNILPIDKNSKFGGTFECYLETTKFISRCSGKIDDCNAVLGAKIQAPIGGSWMAEVEIQFSKDARGKCNLPELWGISEIIRDAKTNEILSEIRIAKGGSTTTTIRSNHPEGCSVDDFPLSLQRQLYQKELTDLKRNNLEAYKNKLKQGMPKPKIHRTFLLTPNLLNIFDAGEPYDAAKVEFQVTPEHQGLVRLYPDSPKGTLRFAWPLGDYISVSAGGDKLDSNFLEKSSLMPGQCRSSLTRTPKGQYLFKPKLEFTPDQTTLVP